MAKKVYWVEGMSGDCNFGRDYFPFLQRVESTFPEGISTGSQLETYVFKIGETPVVLSAPNNCGWAPRFDMFEDSEELKSKLEEKLGVKLR